MLIYLFSTPGDLYTEFGLSQKLRQEWPMLFDASITPEVDALWEKAKKSREEAHKLGIR